MLEPNSRQLLREALRPPSGYILNRAIATTFSLDLMSLLTIPVSFTFFQLKDQEGPPKVDPHALLEALRRFAGRITIFCQAGQIYVPRHIQLLLGYLENSVHGVKAPRGGVFHPKLTVLRFSIQEGGGANSDQAPVVYRLLCSSRNLTFDRSWDTLVISEGALVQHRTNAFSRNHPLARFVRDLPGLAVNPLPSTELAELASIADELLRVDFEIPEGFTDMEFCPLGLGWTAEWPILGYRRMLAMAPFVDDNFIGRFVENEIPLEIISRRESLDDISGEKINYLTGAWYMNTAANSIPVDAEDLGEGSDEPDKPNDDGKIELTPTVQLHGLHAKLFVADDGWDSHVWTGSANSTKAAFERNVEFMVCLTGKKSVCGIDTIVPITEANEAADGDADPDDADDRDISFSDLLMPYTRVADLKIGETEKLLERLLDEARYAVAGAKIEAHVAPLAESTIAADSAPRYRISLTRSLQTPIDIPSDLKVECHPLTLRPSAAQNIRDFEHSPIVIFEPLSFEALTSFFGFRLTLARGNAKLSCAFVLNVPLINAPLDRQARLLFALLKKPEQLLKYLLLLLADDEESARRLIQTIGVNGPNIQADGIAGQLGLPLLEPLLQALDRNPARLDQINRLIEDLRQSPEGQKLVSDQFLAIWQPIWDARKGITDV